MPRRVHFAWGICMEACGDICCGVNLDPMTGVTIRGFDARIQALHATCAGRPGDGMKRGSKTDVKSERTEGQIIMLP